MPDKLPSQISPTGEPIVSTGIVKLMFPVVSLAGGLVAASAAGLDLSFLPPVVLKVSALVAFLGFLIGYAGPGARKEKE